MNDDPAQTITYFGYGSLVNLQTLQTSYISARSATLYGWKRVWLSRPQMEGSFAPFAGLAFLSVRPCEGMHLEGMLVEDHLSSLPSLDQREALYNRVELPSSAVHLTDEDSAPANKTYLYVAYSENLPSGEPPKILRSYLDAVFQGYLHHFGEGALTRFVETTDNFRLEVLEDRDAPIYPRSVVCSPTELALFDCVVPRGGLINT